MPSFLRVAAISALFGSCCLLLLPGGAGAQTISTLAGAGTAGATGDGGDPASALLNFPGGVSGDTLGVLYIADTGNHKIRRVNAARDSITTLAGTGTAGSTGDGGAPTSALLNSPGAVFSTLSGVLYIADTGNHKIRRVNAARDFIATIAGTGTAGATGDSGAAASARLNSPGGVVVTSAGVIFVADTGNHKIRRINAARDSITTYAGTGTAGSSGDGGAARSAKLSSPSGLCLDASGNLYVTDTGNHKIRKITPAGIITTVAGTGSPGFSGDGDLPTNAQLSFPKAVAIDSSGALYISDYFNHRLRRANPGGNITTLAGDGSFGFAGSSGAASLARLAFPSGLFLDRSGVLYLADSGNHRLRRLAPADARGPVGLRTTAPGRLAQLLRVAFIGDGSTRVHSLTLTLADLDTATNLSRSDFADFRFYESADTLIDGNDNLLGTLDPAQFTPGTAFTLQATNAPMPASGSERHYLAVARISPRAVEGHAFKVGFVTGNLATSKGGRGSRVAASSANRLTIDVVATRLSFSTQPGGVIGGQPFQIQPVVKAVDDSGYVDGNFADLVTLGNTGAGTLLLNTATASSGVATFSGVTYLASADDESFSLTADDQATGSEGDLPMVFSSSLVANVVNDPPTVDLSSLVLREDERYIVPVSSVVTDPDDTTFTFTFSSRHISGQVANGQLTLVPEADWYGRDTLTITARDQFGLQASDTNPVEVTPVNDAPRLSLPDTLAFAEDDSLSLDLRAYARDPDDDFATLDWVFTPGQPLFYSFAAGRLVLKAPPDSAGLYRLILRVNDRAFALARDTLTVAVAQVNDLPHLNLPDTTLRQGTTLSLDLKRYAADRDHALTRLAWSATPGAHTTASVSTAGVATVQPDPDYYGPDTLVFTATDPAGGVAADTLHLLLTRVNRAPTLATLPDTGLTAGDTLRWDLRSFAADPDDSLAALQWTVLGARRVQASATGGVLVLRAAPPPAAFTEVLRLRLVDPGGLADTTSLTLRVMPPPQLMRPLPDTAFFAGDTLRLALDAWAGQALPAAQVQWSLLGTQRLRAALDPAARMLTLSAEAGSKGPASFVLQAADSAGHRALDTAVVQVLNPPPRLDFPELSLEAGVPVQLALDTFAEDDEPLAALLWSAVPAPEIPVSINNALRQATLLPAAGYEGQTRIVFRATDAQGAAGADTVQVAIRSSTTPGAPGPGDFDGSGKVTLEDFFLFAEHMGLAADQPGWDPVYDLDRDGQTTFADFFLFADLFSFSQTPTR
ncbi:MAG: tandem-95 repeat protein [Candidatus Handelsmanbacteria bacterium]|nr:tandem-95 repeat protein [Candidatus Handelsmanbacteria bacterium]